MRILVLHCNLASFKDKRKAKGRSNRPSKMKLYPNKPGMADIEYRTPISGLHIYDNPRKNRLAQKILSEFVSIDFFDSDNSAIQIRMDYLVKKSKAENRVEVNRILRRLYAMGLLKGLAIDCDHAKWMRHSSTKGCLIVYVGIEKPDYTKKNLIQKVLAEILKIREACISKHKGTIDDIFVVPNSHLARPRIFGGDPDKDIAILQEITLKLKEKGLKSKLNSYGYAKDILLAINAHKIGYVSRQI